MKVFSKEMCVNKRCTHSNPLVEEIIKLTCIFSFVDLSPTASFVTYDQETVSFSTTSASKGPSDEGQGKKYISFFISNIFWFTSRLIVIRNKRICCYSNYLKRSNYVIEILWEKNEKKLSLIHYVTQDVQYDVRKVFGF